MVRSILHSQFDAIIQENQRSLFNLIRTPCDFPSQRYKGHVYCVRPFPLDGLYDLAAEEGKCKRFKTPPAVMHRPHLTVTALFEGTDGNRWEANRPDSKRSETWKKNPFVFEVLFLVKDPICSKLRMTHASQHRVSFFFFFPVTCADCVSERLITFVAMEPWTFLGEGSGELDGGTHAEEVRERRDGWERRPLAAITTLPQQDRLLPKMIDVIFFSHSLASGLY